MWFAKRPTATPEATPISTPAAATPGARRSQPAPSASVPEAPAAVVEPRVLDKHGTRAPEDWLVEGNRLRAERRWAKADDAYTRAAQHAPNTQTAYVARVASGAVRLEHLGDARGALARYRAAQGQLPRGALAEEIQWGIVEAEHALGNRDQERAALERFLREFPNSPLAEQAKARLD
jgi:TolA-binding protein